jgi:hypothetical protein
MVWSTLIGCDLDVLEHPFMRRAISCGQQRACPHRLVPDFLGRWGLKVTPVLRLPLGAAISVNFV